LADQLPHLDPNAGAGDDARLRRAADGPPSTPRWVKAFGVAAIVLVLLFLILHFTGNSPGGHTPSGPDGNTPSSSVSQDRTPTVIDLGDHTPPVEHGAQQP